MGLFKPTTWEMRQKRDIDGLINALKDSDANVRWNAAGELGKIGDKRAVGPLITAIEDPHKWVRGDAAKALGRIGDPKALGVLEAVKNDNKYAKKAIDKIKSGDAYRVWVEQVRQKRQKKLKLARSYENGLQYKDAVKIYEELGMNDDVQRVKTMLSKSDIVEKIASLQKIPNIFVDDINALLSKNKLDEANKLLSERKNDYNKYLELNNEMKDIDIKLAKLSSKLAEGEITSDAYETANDNLVRRKKDIDEELWKIQRKIFREKYEKPF